MLAWNLAVARLPSQRASLLLYLEPLVSVAGAVALLGERLSADLAVGGALAAGNAAAAGRAAGGASGSSRWVCERGAGACHSATAVTAAIVAASVGWSSVRNTPT